MLTKISKMHKLGLEYIQKAPIKKHNVLHSKCRNDRALILQTGCTVDCKWSRCGVVHYPTS